jgi:two-component sensor histidine kinase
MRIVGAPPDGDLVSARTLFDRVVSGLSDFAFNARIKIELGVEDLKVHGDDGVSLMLIMNELLVNALRHAFPDNIGGTIRISFGLRAAAVGQSVVLVVEDDGIGMDPTTTPPGLGQTLIQTAAQSLGATMVQESGQTNSVRCGSRTSIIKPWVELTVDE